MSKNANFAEEAIVELHASKELQTEAALASLTDDAKEKRRKEKEAAKQEKSKAKLLNRAVEAMDELAQGTSPQDFNGSNLSTEPLRKMQNQIERLLGNESGAKKEGGGMNPLHIETDGNEL